MYSQHQGIAMDRFLLKTQLMFVFLSLAVGFLLFGGWTMSTIERGKVGGPGYDRIVLYKDLIADILPPPNYIIESYLTALLLADPDRAVEHDALIVRLGQLRKDYDARHSFWKGQALPEGIRRSFVDDAHAAAKRFYDTADSEFLPAVRGNKVAETRSALVKLESHYAEHRKAIDVAVELATREQAAEDAATRGRLQRDLWLLLAVFLASATIAATANVLFGRRLLAGIVEARSRLAEIAGGRLDLAPSDSRRADEVGDLLRDLDRTAANLRATVAEISESAVSVSAAAEELSATIGHVADGAKAQSDSVASVAGTLEQMSSGIHEMAERSANSRQRAEAAGSHCVQGSREIAGTSESVGKLAADVESTAGSINTLGERSREISGIVGVIREIADQTNLLALNAAIEAARAGEQGRGFAVVADEVRKLAERTAQSTEQITRMIVQIQDGITASVRGMGEGSLRARACMVTVGEARATMDAIVADTDALVADIRQVADQLEAQRQGSNEIVSAITAIADTSEATTHAAQEVRSTADNLARTASRLRAAVHRFQY
jgi:methyl-accepting chemotaxis protein